MADLSQSVLVVRRSIHIRAAPARVWRAFTSFDAMDRWWGARVGEPEAGRGNGQYLVAYEPHAGGRIEMEVGMNGGRVRYGGRIETFAADRELTFNSDWMPNQGWLKPTRMTIRLTAALGGCLVELFHYGFEATGGDVAATHAGYEQGWGMTQLDALKSVVEASSK